MTAAAWKRYTFGEELANSITHGVGWMLSAAGLAVLVTLAALEGGAMAVTASAVFGTCLVLLYAASTLYHALPCPRAKRVFQVLDHSAIYLLIAGTYTPISLICLRGAWGWSLFGVVWGLAAVGIVLSAVARRRFKVVATGLYVVMGWLVVVAFRPLVASVDLPTLVLLVVGGVSYTFGLVFYAWRRLPYGHTVWHLFVLAGSVLHFLAVARVVVS